MKIYWLYLLLSFFWNEIGTAQSYSSGLKKYRAGDLVDAEDEFSQVAAKSKGMDLAITLKMLGICQYMLGDMESAKTSFTKALKINGDLAISSSEALDTSVLPFFAKIKEAMPSKPAPAAPTAVASEAQTPTVPPPKKITKPAAPPKESQKPATPSKPTISSRPTYINVSSNVKGATVLAGGTPIGNLERPIEIRPGYVNIEVSLSGYETQKKNINIREGQTNFVRIDLTKIDSNRQKLLAKPPAMIEPLQPINPDTKKQAPIKVQPSFALDEDAPPIPRPAKNKKNSAAQATPVTPVRVAPSPTPAPVVANESPTPEGTDEQVTTPVEATNTTDGANAPSDETTMQKKNHQHADAANPESSASAKRKRVVVRKPSTPLSIAITLLPFGSGQFQNDQYVKGSLFAAVEVTALYYFFSRGAEATAKAKATNAEIDRRLITEDGLQGDEKKAYQAETDAFATSEAKHVSKLEAQSKLAIVSFGGFWAIGIIEALITQSQGTIIDKAPAKSVKKKNHSHAPKKKEASIDNPTLTSSRDSTNAELARAYPLPTYHLEVLPAPILYRQNSLPETMLGVKVNF